MAASKILVVEDDPVLLMASALTLADAGLAIIEAENGDEAAAILQTAGADVAVVFSDIDMPGRLDGLALAREITRQWPWISVVLTSGHRRPSGSALPPRTQFLEKPYDIDRVSALIAGLAGRTAARAGAGAARGSQRPAGNNIEAVFRSL